MSTRQLLAKTLILLSLLFGSSACEPSIPAGIIVGCDADELRHAIDEANQNPDEQVIYLATDCDYVIADGRYTSGSDRWGLPSIRTPIIIYGNDARILRSVTNQTLHPDFRFFTISADGELTLKDLTLENGGCNNCGWFQGGAVYVDQGSLTVSRSKFLHNHFGLQGGAIFNNMGAVAIDGSSEFRYNGAASGGALFNDRGAVSVQDSLFEANSVTLVGGAICNDGGIVTIDDNSRFIANTSYYRGGALETTGMTLINNSEFDGNSSQNAGGAIFNSGTLEINNVDLHDNVSGGDGGSIFNENELTILNSDLHANTAGEDGGAIYSAHFVEIEGSNLHDNVSSGDGGGIFGAGEEFNVFNSDIHANSAENGGAIYFSSGNASVIDSEINENVSQILGGAIFNSGVMEIGGTDLHDNVSFGDGGGIFNEECMTVLNSAIHNNLAGGDGGGIFSAPVESGTYGYLEVMYTTVNTNLADHAGGGISTTSQSTTIINSTISGNVANVKDGGIVTDGGQTMIVHSTIAYNTNSGTIWYGGGLSSHGDTHIKNSIVALNSPEDCHAQEIAHLFPLGDNLDSDGTCFGFNLTADPMISDLDDNGGPTPTHALYAFSPAVEAVTDCTAIDGDPVTVDQRGVGRPQGADCDLGAYEMEVISLLQPSSIPSGVPSYEPSSERPSLTALQNLNCRAGPSTRHEIEDTLFEGISAPIEGRDQESTWWYILSPNQGVYCWVSGEQVEIVGDVSRVRVRRAVPPPTREAPTKPPAPQVDCTKYKDPEKCKANPACAWYTQVGSAGHCDYK